MINYYTVGGCVRDELLGVRSKDIDFAVEAESYEAMKEDILNKDMTIFQERPQYFSIRGRHPVLGGVDFTLCRKDGFYSDNRRPDSVEVGTIYDDLARRDFTVNAIAKKVDNEYIDPHKGQQDIVNRVLRCVGDTLERLNEDPLRILRAVRFHITKGFYFDSNLESAMWNLDLLNKLEDLPIERIYGELRKCYEHNSYDTLLFFRKHRFLEDVIFYGVGLKLTPVIGDNA